MVKPILKPVFYQKGHQLTGFVMVYIIEGNIGAGKSTFLSLLKNKIPGLSIIQEPVNSWASQRQGASLLENFYINPKRWAFTLETYTMIARSLELQSLNTTPGIILMERSLYSGHYCFAKNGYSQGFFSNVEWDVYNTWAEFFLQEKNVIPQGFIYLQASPDVCFERIQRRNRNGEQTIALEYLEQIHNCHEQFLVEKEGVFNQLKSVPVLTLNANNEFEQAQETLNEHLNQLMSFIQTTQQQAKFRDF